MQEKREAFLNTHATRNKNETIGEPLKYWRGKPILAGLAGAVKRVPQGNH
jgi:hypothetical protein